MNYLRFRKPILETIVLVSQPIALFVWVLVPDYREDILLPPFVLVLLGITFSVLLGVLWSRYFHFQKEKKAYTLDLKELDEKNYEELLAGYVALLEEKEKEFH